MCSPTGVGRWGVVDGAAVGGGGAERAPNRFDAAAIAGAVRGVVHEWVDGDAGVFVDRPRCRRRPTPAPENQVYGCLRNNLRTGAQSARGIQSRVFAGFLSGIEGPEKRRVMARFERASCGASPKSCPNIPKKQAAGGRRQAGHYSTRGSTFRGWADSVRCIHRTVIGLDLQDHRQDSAAPQNERFRSAEAPESQRILWCRRGT